MTTIEIIQMVLSTLTLFVTASVPIAIFWLQSKHEKEIKAMEDKRVHKELEEKAHVFLSENNNERRYLPLCAIASSIHRHDSYKISIFKNYCLSPLDLQNEILKQANIQMQVPKSTDWAIDCFKYLEADCRECKLGDFSLQDTVKYFHMAYGIYQDREWECLNERKDFKTIAHRISFGRDTNSINFTEYVEEYFSYLYSDFRPPIVNPNPMPPLKYLEEQEKLSDAEEIDICRWVMEEVQSIVVILNDKKYKHHDMREIMGDFSPATFKEKYYLVLLWMYFTYIYEAPKSDVTDRIKKRRKSN